MLTARFSRVFGMIWHSVDDKKLRPSERNVSDGLNDGGNKKMRYKIKQKIFRPSEKYLQMLAKGNTLRYNKRLR